MEGTRGADEEAKRGRGDDEAASGLLTEEELAMLLADDPPRGHQP
jgi:hypothetical protein